MGVVMPDEKDFLTIEEAATLYDVSPKTVHYWLRQGKIKKYQRKLDGVMFVRKAEIDEARAIQPVEDDGTEV